MCSSISNVSLAQAKLPPKKSATVKTLSRNQWENMAIEFEWGFVSG
jgi:hypothetical protein